MTDPLSPEPPTLIIPSRRCWLWWARRAHPPHLVGEIPNTKRCPGVKPKPTEGDAHDTQTVAGDA